jgi:hypothetical protein
MGSTHAPCTKGDCKDAHGKGKEAAYCEKCITAHNCKNQMESHIKEQRELSEKQLYAAANSGVFPSGWTRDQEWIIQKPGVSVEASNNSTSRKDQSTVDEDNQSSFSPEQSPTKSVVLPPNWATGDVSCTLHDCRGCNATICFYLSGATHNKGDKIEEANHELRDQHRSAFLMKNNDVAQIVGAWMFSKVKTLIGRDPSASVHITYYTDPSLEYVIFPNRVDFHAAVRSFRPEGKGLHKTGLMIRIGYRDTTTGVMWVCLSLLRGFCHDPYNYILAAYYSKGKWVVKYLKTTDAYKVRSMMLAIVIDFRKDSF